jgi:tellurite resistance protein
MLGGMETGLSLPPPLYVEADEASGPRLAHFPVTFFATVMGLAGLSLAWQRAGSVLDAPVVIGETLFWVALAVGAAVFTAYAAKVVLHSYAVREEARHPVRLAFLPTIGIALVLLAAAGQEIAAGLAETLWWAGAGSQLLLTLFVLSSWVGRPVFALGQVTPAWFIPVVGLVAVPLAGVRFAPDEVSWFFFATGVLFWIALLPLVLGRLFVHDQPLPGKLMPTLAVLVAPPAVVMLAYLRLVPDGFSTAVPQALFDIALFFALLLATQVPTLVRLPFFLSWWAYSFPLAALSVATIVMAGQYDGALTGAAWTLLTVVTLLIALLAARTTLEIVRGRICVPE